MNPFIKLKKIRKYEILFISQNKYNKNNSLLNL